MMTIPRLSDDDDDDDDGGGDDGALEPPDWDEEACEEAEATADEIAAYDPEAARHLYAQLAAVRRAHTRAAALAPDDDDDDDTARVDGGGGLALALQLADTAQSYNPMRLYAQLARYYHFADHDIERMHFPRAFAYYREAMRMQEEEEAAQEAAMRKSQRANHRRSTGRTASHADTPDTPDTPDAQNAFAAEQALAATVARPQPYHGPVVRLPTAQ